MTHFEFRGVVLYNSISRDTMTDTEHLLYTLTNNPVDFETFNLETIHLLKLTCKDLNELGSKYEEKAAIEAIRGNGKSDIMYNYIINETYINKFIHLYGNKWLQYFNLVKQDCYGINLYHHFDYMIGELIEDGIIDEEDETEYRDELLKYTPAPPEFIYDSSDSDSD